MNILEKRNEKTQTDSWISDETFKLLKKKTKFLKSNLEDVKKFGRELQGSLRKDKRVRIAKVSVEIEDLREERCYLRLQYITKLV